MRLVFVILVVLVFFLGWSEGAKGGAKSVMNRRKGQRSRGGQGGGSNHEDDGEGEGLGGKGEATGDFDSRPCVGICHYQKLKGIVMDKKLKARLRKRRPCVGLCFRRKKMKQEEKKKKKLEMMNKEKKDEEI
eukprot:GFUD01000763.1.p1 GENE.GFUD01000763.1~~GFUD01000763.1.p1  ORF type:complete len:132 (+),score=45.12 GFUD01000763.1:41-436(+)